MTLSADSVTLSPLPKVLSQGLVVVTTFGLLSFICSVSLFIYLTHRLLIWHRQSQSGKSAHAQAPPRPTNQFLVLIYNLLIADIQQSLAFSLNLTTLARNAILVGSPECWAHGWFISTGDLASSVFILAIAAHTYLGLVRQYQLPSLPFYCGIAGCWIFVYALAIIGPARYRRDFYVRAGAWCWINKDLQTERLFLHYAWIFLAIFSTIVLYILVFIHLNRSLPFNSTLTLSEPESININNNHNRHPHNNNHQHHYHYHQQRRHQQRHHQQSPPPTNTDRNLKSTRIMLLYPLIYTVCTTPLAAGRAAAMGGREVSLAYLCVAGSLIACNGWLDVLLYATTRSAIVFAEHPPSEETGLETFAFMGKGHKLGTVTTVTTTVQGDFGSGVGGRLGRNGSVFGRVMVRDRDRWTERRESRENLYVGYGGSHGGLGEGGSGGAFALGQIEVKESVNVTIERNGWEERWSAGSGGGGEGRSVKSLYP